ncbi:hypothetical protein EIP86_010703 [Pleurotus ostreatoroseus]|nr:hypothetical protein EIP86_010703 [Pleurotus ostreatoroseus]
MPNNIVRLEKDNPLTRRATVLQALEEQDRLLAELSEWYHVEVSRIESTKRYLQTQYNGTAPVSCLPPEVLALIFAAFVDDYWTPDSTNTHFCMHHNHQMYKPPMCGWIVILQVCHCWRAIALDTPRLWTRIAVGPLPYIQFAIAHSGNLPLDAFAAQCPQVQREDDPEIDILQCLLSEFHRLRSAVFRMSFPVKLLLETARTAGIKLQAPALEALTLMIDTREFLTSIPLLSEMDLPRLTSLALERASFNLLQSLSRPVLTVVNVSFSPPCKPSELIELLDKLPLLRHLELSGFEEQDRRNWSRRIPPWFRTISLPHLKYLSMASDLHALDMTHLLGCLDFPVDTIINISMGAQRDGPVVGVNEEYELILPRVLNKALVSNMAAISQATQAVIPRIMEISSTGRLRHLLNVALSSSIPLCGAEEHLIRSTADSGPRLRLTIVTPGLSQSSVILRLFNLVDLSELVKLGITGAQFPSHVWMQIFQDLVLPKLQDLVLKDYGTIASVLLAMSTPIPGSSQGISTLPQEHMDDSARCYLFPTLKTLTLSNCVFRANPRQPHPHDLIDRILEELEIRAEHGYQLDKLIVDTPINLTRAEDLAALEDPLYAKHVEIGAAKPGYCDEDTDGGEDQIESEDEGGDALFGDRIDASSSESGDTDNELAWFHL